MSKEAQGEMLNLLTLSYTSLFSSYILLTVELPDVNKNKIIWPKKRVTKVYELPVNYFDYKLNTKFEVIK